MIAVAIAFVVALLTGLAAMPWVIAHLAAAGLTGNDVNKPDRPSVPNIGGIAVVFSLAFGVLVAMAVSATGTIPAISVSPMLGALSCVLVVAMIGLADDLLRMPPVLKGTLPVLAAIPPSSWATARPMSRSWCSASSASASPLVLVPIGSRGPPTSPTCSGFNGMGWMLRRLPVAGPDRPARRAHRVRGLLFAMLGALLVLLRFSWFPAKVFPGDTATLDRRGPRGGRGRRAVRIAGSS
jgi:UDP-N-acetylglucosamine--dolichyl-phosphate N-acetylglucosaminephosphotransferase